MKEQQETFLQELQSIINNFEEALLELEAGINSAESIDALYRTLHSIKGSASMFGFPVMAHSAHTLENIFERIKAGELKAEESISLCYDFSEYVKQCLTAKSETDYNQLADELISRAGKYSGTQNLTSSEQSLKTYRFLFKPNANIDTKGIDLFSFLEMIQKNGKTFLYERPTEPENLETKFYMWWEIFTIALSKDAITEGFIFDDNEIFIEKIADSDILNDTAFESEFEKLNQEKKDYTTEEIKSIAKKIETKQNKANTLSLAREKTKDIKVSTIKSSDHIQVKTKRLDELMNYVSELVTLKETVNIAAKKKNFNNIELIAEKLEAVSRRIQDNALSMRLVQLNSVIPKLEILIRKIARTQGKKVNFETDGTETELDKTIIDNIFEPMMHILRNSIDHGIELPEERTKLGKAPEGRIKLFASYTGDTVVIQIHDDGRGLDCEKIKKIAIKKGLIEAGRNIDYSECINLIMKAGFSTAEKVSDISGRGVGMDVVKSKITELRGETEIASEAGLGTYITIKLPLTLSIVDTLHIKVNDNDFLIPKHRIINVDEIKYEDFKKLKNSVLPDIYENKPVSVINLKENFSIKSKKEEEYLQIIYVSFKKQKYGLVADSIIGDHQAVIKPLGGLLNKDQDFSGASILGNGSLALMIDIAKLIKKY